MWAVGLQRCRTLHRQDKSEDLAEVSFQMLNKSKSLIILTLVNISAALFPVLIKQTLIYRNQTDKKKPEQISIRSSNTGIIRTVCFPAL